MFEPIGGTAPMWTGKNAINPLAAIGAGAMLLTALGEEKAGAAIEAAIAQTTPKMKSQIANQMGFTTTQVGDLVAATVAG
jgi:3-isopropylmalate dehydrogenase